VGWLDPFGSNVEPDDGQVDRVTELGPSIVRSLFELPQCEVPTLSRPLRMLVL
jgi:hypothetical protein